jgi:Ca2+-binding EF-hand superfamily protein
MSESSSSLADQLFSATDADGDGVLTAEELADAIEAKNAESGGSVDAEELFAALDADGDGLITAAEHEAGLESLRANNAAGLGGGQSGSSDDDEEETYDAADTNEDGIVDTEELLESLGVATSSESEMAASLFDALTPTATAPSRARNSASFCPTFPRPLRPRPAGGRKPRIRPCPRLCMPPNTRAIR